MQATADIDYKRLYEDTQIKYDESQIRIVSLEHQLKQLHKMIFGSRHERFVPADENSSQLSLGISAESVACCKVTDAQKIAYTKTSIAVESKPVVHPGRMKLPEHLRREELVIEPAADIAGCKKIGDDITEILEYVPGELFVKKYIRPKYALPGNSGVVVGELPTRPLEKAMAGEGLLAQIIIDKYVDHLPLYRQMQRFERSGVKLAYSTITDWVSNTCQLITPLFEALKAEVLQAGYLHADETPIKVISNEKKGKTHQGYYWVYQDSKSKLVFFDYQEGRGREGPVEILANFKGYLQSDGFTVYERFDKRKDVTLMHCMAHARRKFSDALNNDEARASYALQEIQKLYAIERSCKEQDLNADQIKQVRQEQSVPILTALGEWMKLQYAQTLNRSVIGEALAYSIKRWDRLMIYTQDGNLNIDNNPVENSIRPVALGRKNYLFAGSHEAAKRSGMLYSLLGTCKMHGIEPTTWLKEVLRTIPTHPINKIKTLLPQNWKI
jgi:transposase